MTEIAQRFREFKMPDVGEGLTEAEILKWYVKSGDSVTDGQVVCEVETAKAAVELPIPYDGVVHEIRFPEGDTVDVGTVIISVDTGASGAPDSGDAGAGAGASAPGSGAESGPEAGPAPDAAQKRQPVLVGYGVATSSTKRRPRKPPAVPGRPVSSAGTPVPVHPVAAALQGEPNGHGPAAPALGAARTGVPAAPLAKPPVRKLAKDLGVDLTALAGSGPNGAVTREDVEAASSSSG
ncbi:MAG: hypothetical protein QOI83_2202, partial [Streptomycetaceae bacterium]|nr:hypothetical protein [Streptomycetaceae bacterium]